MTVSITKFLGTNKWLLCLFIALIPFLVNAQIKFENPLSDSKRQFVERTIAIQIMDQEVKALQNHPVIVNNDEKGDLFFPMQKRLLFFTGILEDLYSGSEVPDAIFNPWIEIIFADLSNNHIGYGLTKVQDKVVINEPEFIRAVELLSAN